MATEIGVVVKDICALCLEEKELQLSHIVPKFVFSYVKRSAPSALRSYRTPNLRIQDGEKEYLLCRECEQLFSGWEKLFSELLFTPLHNPLPVTIPIIYRDWALKFAVSVSWRVLQHYAKKGLHHFSDEQKDQVNQALNTWRRFLIGDKKNPASFEQHLLPLDVIEQHSSGNVSPFLNRYLLRAIHTDVLATQTSALVYTKLCRVLIVGFIHEDNPFGWKGTKMHVNRGVISPRDYLVPAALFDYINDKASQAKKALDSLSPNQDQKVAKFIRENLDSIGDSEIFRAMSYDVHHSGKAAFKPSKEKDQAHEVLKS